MNRRDFCRLATWAPILACAPRALAGSGPLLDQPPFWVEIDPRRRYQELAGFGASGAFHMAAILRWFPAGEQARMLDLLFSATAGAGLSVVRNIIPPEDGRQPPVLSRAGVADWSADADQVWLMRQAAQRGCTRFISSAWTPPPWMKTNNSIVGGRLRPDCYAAYANYLATYAEGYERHHGLSLYAVSPQNEPDVTVKYASCAWNGEEFRRFVGGHLGPVWRRRKIPAQIMLGENSEWTEAPAVASLEDAEARAAVGIVASHAYFGDNHVPEVPLGPRTGVFTLAGQYAKPVWQTEVSAFNANDPGIADALYWAKLVHFHLAEDNVSGWLYWWLVSPSPNREALIHLEFGGAPARLRRNRSPAPAARRGPQSRPRLWGGGKQDARPKAWPGPAPGDAAWLASKRLFALGQFSRFLRPGAVRVAATANPAPEVYVSAYVLPGQCIVVMINGQERPALAALKLLGGAAGADRAAGRTVRAWRTSRSEDLAAIAAPIAKAAAGGAAPGLTAMLAPQSITTLVLGR